MIKSVFKTFIIFFVYYILNFLLEKLFAFIFVREVFMDINMDYFLLINTFTYVVYILLAYLFMKKAKVYMSNVSISFRSVIVIIILICSFRIFIDPILRLEIILGNSAIPDTIEDRRYSILNLVITFINIIILAPLFEELFFRKIMLSFFNRKKLLVGILISSFAFSTIHVNWSSINILHLIVFFIFGLISCFIYIRHGLFYSILFHLGYNLIWYLVNVGVIEYWIILKTLDFSVGYWVLVLISLISIIYSLFKGLKLKETYDI